MLWSGAVPVFHRFRPYQLIGDFCLKSNSKMVYPPKVFLQPRKGEKCTWEVFGHAVELYRARFSLISTYLDRIGLTRLV